MKEHLGPQVQQDLIRSAVQRQQQRSTLQVPCQMIGRCSRERCSMMRCGGRAIRPALLLQDLTMQLQAPMCQMWLHQRPVWLAVQ